ncbi:CheB methylesterase domain-containing protein [Elusimicrobiota bacterium]
MIENPAENSIIGIAVSIGGPTALLEILNEVPEDFFTPIIIVQHIAEGFTKGMAAWLDKECEIEVKEAANEDKINPGAVYIAPSGYQLKISKGRRAIVTREDIPGIFHKPSADITLTSLAEVYGGGTIGVIMTGMGRDGVEGIKAIRDAGGYTIAQDEETSTIYGMNQEAVNEGTVTEILPLNSITDRLVELCTGARIEDKIQFEKQLLNRSD